MTAQGVPKGQSARWACDVKQAFASFSAAKRVISRMARGRSTRKGGLPMAYRCQFCGAWHIGGAAL